MLLMGPGIQHLTCLRSLTGSSMVRCRKMVKMAWLRLDCRFSAVAPAQSINFMVRNLLRLVLSCEMLAGQSWTSSVHSWPLQWLQDGRGMST